MNKRWIAWLCLLVLALGVICPAAAADQRVFRYGQRPNFGEDEPLLELYVCPVIGSDAMILACEGHYMAVDTGLSKEYQVMSNLLKRLGVERLEMVFNSHPHNDHLGGFVKMMRTKDIPVDAFLTAFPENYVAKDTLQKEAVAAARANGVEIRHVSDGDVFYLGSAKLTCMQTMFKRGDTNNSTCVLLVEYGDSKLLLTGDIDSRGQSKLISTHPKLPKVDIMKVPHHGLAYLKKSLMDRVKPEYMFIPHAYKGSENARQWMDLRKIPYDIASRGLIHMATNGQYWLVKQEKK